MDTSNKAIATLVKSIVTSQYSYERGGATYLRALVAGAQTELDGKRGKSEGEQLAALTATHERYYTIVVKTLADLIPRAMKDRPKEMNRRAGFARTAVYALRSHVRAGEDICALSAAKVTRGHLKSAPVTSEMAERRTQSKVARYQTAYLQTIADLARADRGAAVSEIESVLALLEGQLAELKTRVSVRPARAGNGVPVAAPH